MSIFEYSCVYVYMLACGYVNLCLHVFVCCDHVCACFLLLLFNADGTLFGLFLGVTGFATNHTNQKSGLIKKTGNNRVAIG